MNTKLPLETRLWSAAIHKRLHLPEQVTITAQPGGKTYRAELPPLPGSSRPRRLELPLRVYLDLVSYRLVSKPGCALQLEILMPFKLGFMRDPLTTKLKAFAATCPDIHSGWTAPDEYVDEVMGINLSFAVDTPRPTEARLIDLVQTVLVIVSDSLLSPGDWVKLAPLRLPDFHWTV